MYNVKEIASLITGVGHNGQLHVEEENSILFLTLHETEISTSLFQPYKLKTSGKSPSIPAGKSTLVIAE